MLNVQKEIKSIGFEETVEKYKLKVHKDRGLISLNYDQIKSPKCIVTNECRGLILYEFDFSIAAYPFFRFFNIQEGHAEKVDLSRAKILSKEDGTCIIYFYNRITGSWQCATRGRPFADGEICGLIREGFSFASLFQLAVQSNKIDLSEIQRSVDHTFIFELVSPYNRIVTKYDNPDIYLLGARNNNTLREKDGDWLKSIAQESNIKSPRELDINNYEEVEKELAQIAATEEGFVAVDYSSHSETYGFSRVKIKNPRYLALAHMINAGGGLSKKRVISLIQKGETDEVILHFPEFESEILEIENAMNDISQYAEDMLSCIEATNPKTQKEFAEKATKTLFPWVLFQARKEKPESVCDIVKNAEPQKVEQMIGTFCDFRSLWKDVCARVEQQTGQ